MIIAIDPGITGAIAHIHDEGRFCCVEDMPRVGKMVDAANLHTMLHAWGREAPTRVILEQVGAGPGVKGTAGAFNFGRSYGIVLGVVASLRLPLELVTPGTWKRHMGLSKDKEASRLKALQLFPNAADVLKRKKDEGRAEALLLGLWFARRLQVQHDTNSAGAA